MSPSDGFSKTGCVFLFLCHFCQNGYKMGALRAHEQYVHQSQLCIAKAKKHLRAWVQKHYHEKELSFRLLLAEVDDKSRHQGK